MNTKQKALRVPVVVLIFALTALSGCQIFSNKAPDQGTIDHVPQDRRIGMIQSLGGIHSSNQGTHILTMDDGSTILLRSLSINLNDPKYLTKKVEVSGVLTYTTDGKQIMEVESIDILDVAPVTQQAVAVTWRDYVNATMGFSAKYRDDFTVREGDGEIAFTRPVRPEAQPTQELGSSMAMEVVSDHVIAVMVTSHAEVRTEAFSESRIGVDGIEAKKYVSPTSAISVNFTFDDGTHFYTISYTGGNDAQSLEDQNVFYQFLASFKLLNPSAAVSQQVVFKNVPATPVAPPPAVMPKPDRLIRADDPPSPIVTSTSTPQPVVAPPAVAAPAGPVTGFETFTSAGYKFSIQYPKGWYFGQSSTTDSGVTRRYNFGTKPVDAEPGSVNLDIGTGLSGEFTFTGKNGRVYRLSGPSSMSTTLQAMIGTIQEQ